MNDPRVLFGTPLKGRKHPAMDASLNAVTLALEQRGRVRGRDWDTYVETRGDIALAQTLLAMKLLELGWEKLAIIHGDVSHFTPEDVDRMTRSPEDVVVGLAADRSAWSEERVARAIAAGVPIEQAVCHGSPLCFVRLQENEIRARGFGPRTKDGHLFEIERAASSFMVLSRRAIELVASRLPFAPHRTWWDDLSFHHVFMQDVCENTADAKHYLLSEDSAFFLRWRMTGGVVWADTKIRLRHWGEWGFRGPALEDIVREGLSLRETDGPCEVHDRDAHGLLDWCQEELYRRKAEGKPARLNICRACHARGKLAAGARPG